MTGVYSYMKGMLLAVILAFSTLPEVTTASLVRLLVNSTAGDMPFYCQYCHCSKDAIGIRSDCFSLGLFRPPRQLSLNTTELYMRGNRIPVVKYGHLRNLTKLRVLDLSFNVINRIEVGAFEDLVNLEVLFLDDNKFNSYSKAIIPGVFRGLAKLRRLSLHGCITWRTAMNVKLPQTPFVDLVGLEKLSIDGVKNVQFGEEFTKLKQLTSLTMSGVDGECAIMNLSRFSFVGVPHLEHLVVEKCDIGSIDTDAFYTLNNLTILDLSGNVRLGFAELGKLYLQSTKLAVLKINSIHAPYRAGSELLRENMRNIRHCNSLVAIFMDSNGLEYIDYGVFDLLPKSVKYLSMRDNRLNFGFYVYEAVFNTALEVFDAGSQYPVIQGDRAYTDVYYNFINEGKRRKRDTVLNEIFIDSDIVLESHGIEFDKTGKLWNTKRTEQITDHHQNDILETQARRELRLANEVTISIPTYGGIREKRSSHERGVTTIRKLICSGSMSGLHLVDFNNTDNNITYIDISRNFIKYIKANSFLGLDRIRLLNLSENYIEHVDKDAFIGLQSLRTLDLQNNLLGFRLSIDVDGTLFSWVPNVINLNLSMNRISRMNPNVLSKMTNVETIDLSLNHMHDLNIDLKGLSRLRFLNLSNNRIQQLDSDTRLSLNGLGERRAFAIDFSFNNFMCNCETISFLQWLNSAPIDFIKRDQYYCTLNNGTVRYMNSSQEILTVLEHECTSYIGIIMSCSITGSFLASLALFFVLYRQRWRLLYLYYMAKAKLDVHTDMCEQDIRFQYDIFVSYGDGDRMFVIKEMIEHLENEAGLKLNIRDREFNVGEMIAVNISRAVRTSKRTLLLLSRSFLKNKWCNFEMNMAHMEALHMKRKVLVVVFLEPIPNHLIPLELLDLLRESPSIDFPQNNLERHAFWEKCKELVNV